MLELILILAIVYLFAIRCRSGHPGLKDLQGWNYAHRGLHGEGIPENSMAAFKAALDHGYGIELDIHLLKDGSLAVLHDHSLKRTAGADVMIEDLTAEDLENYRLEGTEEKIPLFSEVLALYDGRQPLIVELKVERNNYAQLAEAACNMLDTYDGPFCIESFDPRCIHVLKKKYPHIIRGQLTRDYSESDVKLAAPLKWALKHQVLNFMTMPDFVAYRYHDRKTLSNFICRHFSFLLYF